MLSVDWVIIRNMSWSKLGPCVQAARSQTEFHRKPARTPNVITMTALQLTGFGMDASFVV